VTERRRGLGRGLGALIPTAPPGEHRASSPVDVFFPRVEGDGVATDTLDPTAESLLPPPVSRETSTSNNSGELLPVQGARFAELDVNAIRPNARQPRQVFEEEEMAELAASIAEVGLLQPVVVRETNPGSYELVMGERRWRATQQAGLATIPAIIRDTTDVDMLRDALLENLHRSDLSPLEEAAAYQQLLDDFGCTHDELAVRINRSRPQITNTLRLLKLPPVVQRRVAARVLSAGHARALLGLPDAGAQERLAQRIVAEGLSVRAVEEIVMLGGESERPARQPRAPKPVAPRLADIAARLSDRLDTRVKVELGRTKGKVIIEFASIEDLERIVGSLAPTPDDPLSG
jgi:ParB family chromosome partitioning protein